MIPDQYDNHQQSQLRAFVGAMVVVLLIGLVWVVFFDNDGGAEPGAGDTTASEGNDGTADTIASEGSEGSVPAEDPDGAVPAGDDADPASDTSADAGDSTVALPADPLQGVELQTVASGLQQPTILVTPPGETRMFVAERFGSIRVMDDQGLVEGKWLDLSDRVLAGGIEQGLLGLTFHPDYATNGRFFVYYTNKDGHRTLSEFEGGQASADSASEKILFSLPQPPGSVDIRHYAGMVQFGPDGHLYVSLGDGASAREQGQNTDTFYAAILRLDVDSGDPYGVPADNPFVGGGGAEEVWAYGLRNPWRFWIDPVDELLYVADVGPGDREEVSILPLTAGPHNLGWPNVEGTRCFFEDGCDPSDYVLPVVEYGHGEEPGQGCSVTGGIVYRGSAIPELDGTYFYADWCAGWLKSFAWDGANVTDETDWTAEVGELGQPNGMGADADGELHIVTFEGDVIKLVPIR